MSEFRFFAFTDFEFHTNSSQYSIDLPISPFQPTKRTTTDEISHELNVPYTVFEILVAICAVVGNLMVIIVFQRERRLRRRTNYYIVSLAMADFLVGSLAVPFAILASIGLPTNLYACLFTVSLLVVLCTISIFCLVAVSVDRYWAILYPMAYSRNVRTKTAIVIISLCWLAGSVVGFLPLFGWHADVGPNQACLFVEVMDYNYLVFLYFATIITPALLMLAFYTHIYRVIVKQVRQIVTMNPVGDYSRRSSTAQIQLPTPTSIARPCHGGTMLRVLGASRKREVKATQNLSIIVLFFMICWFPLYTINCIQAFCPTCEIPAKLTFFCIILSHLNSAVNPVLYAYHLKDFRAALKNLILKIMGVEVEQQAEAIHRFSLASQHRLQSIDSNMRNSTQPRIYIDSPIWLRQQQQQSLKNAQLVPKCGVISPCLNNINHTVAAVAAVTPDIEREMWNIMEASSGAELADINYEFTDNKDDQTPTPPPRHHRRSSRHAAGSGSPYSYDNRNYSSSPDEVEYDEVFLPNQSTETLDSTELNKSLIACAMREKLRSDTPDEQTQLHSSHHVLTDSSYSDNEYVRQTPVSNERETSCGDTPQLSNSSTSLENSTIFIIDTDTAPPTVGHKPKFKKSKSPQLPGNNNNNKCTNKAARTRRRSCSSYTSDAQSLSRDVPSPPTATTTTSPTSPNAKAASTTAQTHSALTNNNNNSQHTNNLNYFTFQNTQQTPTQPVPPHRQHHHHQHHHNHQQQQQQQNQQHGNSSYRPEKFSPLRAVSNFIFPPIKVKHSSLFQLFHPCPSSDESKTSEGNTTNATTTTTIISESPPDLVHSDHVSTTKTESLTSTSTPTPSLLTTADS